MIVRLQVRIHEQMREDASPERYIPLLIQQLAEKVEVLHAHFEHLLVINLDRCDGIRQMYRKLGNVQDTDLRNEQNVVETSLKDLVRSRLQFVSEV